MTKFILHGGFSRTLNEQNRKFREEVVKDVPENGQLLIVYFSRPDDEYPKLASQDVPAFKEAAGGKKINIVIAGKDNFIEELKSSQAIFMRGGRTELLADELKKHPELKDLIKGKTIAGSSAGAYVLSRYYHSASRGGIHEGLGILPLRMICHYQSDTFKFNDDPVSLMEKYPKDLPLIILKDFEYTVINQ